MRHHIAQCALKLFHENGYEAVSMRKVAAEAGCTVMTLYRYYERKIDILRTLWGEIFKDIFLQLSKVAVEQNNPEQRLQAISKAYVQYWLSHRDHYFLVFMSSGVSQTDVSIFVGGDGVIDHFSMVTAIVGEALGADVSEDMALLKAQSLICSLHGISHNLITISGYDWVEPDMLVQEAVSSLLKNA